jgi:hypothetical protein
MFRCHPINHQGNNLWIQEGKGVFTLVKIEQQMYDSKDIHITWGKKNISLYVLCIENI